MAGNFLTTVLVNGESEGTSTAQQVKTYDLPRANLLSHILIKAVTTGTSPTFTLNRVQILGNGSAAIVDLTGVELQTLCRFLFATAAPTNLDGGASADYVIPFSRFVGDVDALLSAKLFRTLQLKLTFTMGGTITTSSIDVHTIEYVSTDNPYSKWQFRYTEINGSLATAASGTKDQSLPLGSLHRHYLVNATGTDGTTVSETVLRINNGAELPIDAKWTTQQMLNALTRSAVGTVANWNFFDMDPDKSLNFALQSAAANDMTFRFTVGAGAQTIAVVLSDAVLIPEPK